MIRPAPREEPRVKGPWSRPREWAEPASAATTRDPSLELLYRHHHAWLLRQIRQRFGKDQAEDLLQDTYLRASAYQGQAVRNPKALLLQIATRAAIDRERRRAVRAPWHDLAEDNAQAEAEQAEALALKQVILALPRHLQEVFVLSRFAGLTYDEIAAQLGISLKTVEWRMTKALKICAAKLL